MVNQEYILTKSGELFLKYGLKSISVDDIARHLAISKKTIYQFFKDKNEIVEHFVKFYLDQKIKQVEEISKNAVNVLEELYKTSIMMKEMLSSINPTMLYDLKKYHPKAWIYYQNYRRSVLEDHIYHSIERGKKEGYFRKEVNSKILARLRVELIDLAFDRDIFDPNEFNITDVQMQFFENFIMVS